MHIGTAQPKWTHNSIIEIIRLQGLHDGINFSLLLCHYPLFKHFKLKRSVHSKVSRLQLLYVQCS
jgi:hypothetical protein